MPSYRSPRVATATSGGDDDALTVIGQSGERLRVVALNETIFRLTHEPDGAPRNDRTWCVVGDADIPREGRARNDLTPLRDRSLQPTHTSEEGLVALETSKLRVEACAVAGEHFALRWVSVGQGGEIAKDRGRGAYMYDECPGGGAVRHYMAADDRDKYFGFGEASGALDRAGRRLRVAATDAMGYNAKTSDPLYKHFPCAVVLAPAADGTTVAYGVLYDNLAQGSIDLGQEISAFRGKYRYYEAEKGDVDMYFVLGPTVIDVVQKLSWLSGRSAPPPRWALGYLGSTVRERNAT